MNMLFNFNTTFGKKSVFSRIICLSFLIICSVMLLSGLTGCEAFLSTISHLKGSLIGNDYIISQYDDFGNKILEVSGDKVSTDSVLDTSGEESSYIDIFIDGYEWRHVGSTLIFAQNGVDMITDFSMPASIETSGDTSLGLIAADRFVNKYKNLFGKELVVLISSQNGTPIGLFQGDSYYTEIPANLPKTTLIHIDGKVVYAHRADVDIIPAKMFGLASTEGVSAS